MTETLASRGIRAVILDIEGTTTPIAFVHETLFSYARTHLDQFLREQRDDPAVAEALEVLTRDHHEAANVVSAPSADVARGWGPAQLKEEAANVVSAPSADVARGWGPAQVKEVSHFIRSLMDRDSKSAGLKTLQGLIWEQGYQSGELRGIVFDDVPSSLRRWHDAGLTLAIYSSGSEHAQRRLFQSTVHGDLTPLFAGFFDTRVGAKREAASYRTIARELELAPSSMLFVSDVAAELDAARDAGMHVVLSVRPGNPPQPHADRYERVTTFEAIR